MKAVPSCMTVIGCVCVFEQSYRGHLKGVVSPTVVQVMAHTGDKESKDLYIPIDREGGRLGG